MTDQDEALIVSIITSVTTLPALPLVVLITNNARSELMLLRLAYS